MKLTEFAQLMIDTKQANYQVEKDYVFTEVRKRFNEVINFSARYVEGRKVIKFDNVQHLKLGFRKMSDGFVSYNVAFSRFVAKCRQDKFAKSLNLEPLEYEHNIYV